MPRYFTAFFLLYYVLNPGVVHAETLTLQEAVNIALENNTLLKAHSWSVRSREEDLKAAKGQVYPNIRIEEKFIRTDNPTYGFMAKLNQERFSQEDFVIDSLNDPRDISDFQTSFSFTQPIIAPRIHYGISLAQRELDARNAEGERVKDEVTRAVIKNSLMIQTAKEYLSVSRLALENAREHRRLASLRHDTGTGLYSDVLRADAAIKDAEVLIAKAEGDLEKAQRAFGLVLGRTEPVDMIDEKPFLPLYDITVYLEAAAQREDVKALNLRYENALANIKMEKSVFMPELGLEGSYQLNDHKDPFSPEGESYMVAAFLRWNLFDASLYHRVKKAEADAMEIKERAEGLKQEIQFRVHEAYIRIKEKEKTRSLAEAARDDTGEALRLVRTRYENSLSPMVDLLDIQVMADRSRAQAVEAANDYLNAVIDLYYESGTLLKTLRAVNWSEQ